MLLGTLETFRGFCLPPISYLIHECRLLRLALCRLQDPNLGPRICTPGVLPFHPLFLLFFFVCVDEHVYMETRVVFLNYSALYVCVAYPSLNLKLTEWLASPRDLPASAPDTGTVGTGCCWPFSCDGFLRSDSSRRAWTSTVRSERLPGPVFSGKEAILRICCFLIPVTLCCFLTCRR